MPTVNSLFIHPVVIMLINNIILLLYKIMSVIFIFI